MSTENEREEIMYNNITGLEVTRQPPSIYLFNSIYLPHTFMASIHNKLAAGRDLSQERGRAEKQRGRKREGVITFQGC